MNLPKYMHFSFKLQKIAIFYCPLGKYYRKITINSINYARYIVTMQVQYKT